MLNDTYDTYYACYTNQLKYGCDYNSSSSQLTFNIGVDLYVKTLIIYFIKIFNLMINEK